MNNIEYLVFSGGGVLGISMIGILRILDNESILKNENIKIKN